MQLDPPITLNGLPLRYSLQFYPSTFFLLTHVVVLSLAFLSTYVEQLSFFLPLIADVNVFKMVVSALMSFWHWFKFFPPKPTKVPVTKVSKARARKLLKMLMFATASLPTIGTTGAHYQSKKGIPNPAKIISSTSNLSAFNLQELKTRLEHSTLFSLFNGVLSQPVNPVLLDCGASACTSPDIDAFEPETLQTLKKPIMMQGVGGGVEITMQGILSYQTIDDNGNPLII